MSGRNNLDPIFNPRSIAIVGASRDINKGGGMFLWGLGLSGYEGKLFPVNPKETEINSLRCYPNIREVPEPVDLAILTVANRLIPAVLQECAQKGVKHVVVHSAGFGEIDEAGKKLEQEIVEIARRNDIRLVGPNCMGVSNPEVGLNTIVPNKVFDREKGVFSFVGQSGWGTENVLLMCRERGVRPRRFVSSGNQTDLDVIDYLEHFASDEGTAFMGAYIEGLRRADQFVRLLGPIARKKPVLILKGGRTRAGSRAALSHTGSLGGSSEVFEGVVRQTGIVRVESFEDMADAAVAFSSPFYPSGKRVGLVVEAGGAAVTAGDFCEQMGLEVPTLSDAVRSTLETMVKGVLPPTAGLSNPVDLVWPPEHLALEIVTQTMRHVGPEVDSLLFVTYQPLNSPALLENLTRLRDELRKPIFVVPGHHTESRPHIAGVTKAGLPCFTTPYRACRALSLLSRFSTR